MIFFCFALVAALFLSRPASAHTSYLACKSSQCGCYLSYLKYFNGRSQDLTFEMEGIGRHPYAMSEQLPELYQDLMEVQKAIPDYTHFFLRGFQLRESFPKLLETIRQHRNDLSAELKEIVNTHRGLIQRGRHPDKPIQLRFLETVDDLLSKKMELLTPDEIEARHGRENWTHKLDWRKFLDLKTTFQGQFTGTNEQLEALDTIGRRVHAAWAELRVAFLVPRIRVTNLRIENAATFFSLPPDKVQKLPPELRHREIDILFNLGKASPTAPMGWGEVKSYSFPLELNQHSHTWEELESNLRDFQQVIKRLGLGGRVKLQLYLLGGASRQARARLIEMGYDEVYAHIEQ